MRNILRKSVIFFDLTTKLSKFGGSILLKNIRVPREGLPFKGTKCKQTRDAMVAYEDEEIEPFTKVRNVYAVRACSSFVHSGISQLRNFTLSRRNSTSTSGNAQCSPAGDGNRWCFQWRKGDNEHHSALGKYADGGEDDWAGSLWRQAEPSSGSVRWLGAACRCM